MKKILQNLIILKKFKNMNSVRQLTKINPDDLNH